MFKMNRRLTEDETLKFVQLYRQHECLWDVRSVAYKHKLLRMSALRQIRDEMDIDGLNIDEIKTKIKIIRSTYYLELNKIEKSSRAGIVYVPRIKWFNELNSFIRTVASRRTFMYSSEHDNNAGPSTNRIAPPVTQTPLRTKSKSTQRSAPMKSYKLNDIVSRTDEESDYDLFGKSVTSQLKKLSEEQAAIAQESIQSVLTQCKLADIRARKSNLSNSAYSYQNPVLAHSTQLGYSEYIEAGYQQPLKCSPCSPSGNILNENEDSSSTYKNEPENA